MHKIYFFKKIAENLKSGLAVSVVSIPLAVSLAVASHATPVEGVITAIWAGLVASIFGGSNYNIIGPTGALSGILAMYAVIHGQGVLPVLAVMSGILILIAYFFRLERYLIFVPASTINGFVLGVAFIIVLNQINFAFNLVNLPQHERFVSNVLESLRNIGNGSLVIFLIFIAFVIALFLLKKVIPSIPGAIIVTPFGILLGYLSTQRYIPLEFQTLGTKFGEITPKLFSIQKMSLPTQGVILSLILPAFTIALISILETMISARIADGITKTKHNKQKEMCGLGLANVICGLAGGIPATAALARTTLNIRSGATHKISATISSFFIILISFLFIKFFKFMPLAVVAAILTVVGIGMIEHEHFIKMYRVDKTHFFLALLVAAVTIFEDPIVGILFGAVISMLIFMQKISHGQFEQKRPVVLPAAAKIDVFIYSMKGVLVYINSQAHIARFETQVPEQQKIILDLKHIYFIDQDGIEAFDEIVELLHCKNKTVEVIVSNEFVIQMLESSKYFTALKKQGLVFDKLD